MAEQETSQARIIQPCPAAIWLLGGAASCGKPEWHDGPHQVIIEWAVKGAPDGV